MIHAKTLLTTVSSITLFLAIHASPAGSVIDQNWRVFIVLGAIGILYAGRFANGA